MSDKRHSVKSIFFGPIVVLGLTAAYLAVGWSSPQSVGYWRDDGIYVSNARALAEGHGYRRVATPEAPLETQKPIAYPAAFRLRFTSPKKTIRVYRVHPSPAEPQENATP
jgi:hypothetical protein